MFTLQKRGRVRASSRRNGCYSDHLVFRNILMQQYISCINIGECRKNHNLHKHDFQSRNSKENSRRDSERREMWKQCSWWYFCPVNAFGTSRNSVSTYYIYFVYIFIFVCMCVLQNNPSSVCFKVYLWYLNILCYLYFV